MRDYRFDVARVVCMTYIVAFMHLYGYVYPQGRVTDHRVNVTSYDLTGVLNGDLDQFIDAMILKERAELLAQA